MNINHLIPCSYVEKFTKNSIYLSIYLSVTCVQAQGVEFTVPDACDGVENVGGCLIVQSSFGSVVESTISISGSLGAIFLDYLDLQSLQKIFFEMDLSEGGQVIIDFETINPVGVHQFDVEYSALESVDIDELDINITADCGDGSGGVTVELTEAMQVSVEYFDSSFESIGDEPSIEDLIAGDYYVSINDVYCAGADTLILLTVPDGSFTLDVTTIEPLLNCVNSVSDEDASGVVPATIEGTIDGGSGEFDVLIDFGSAVSSSEEFDFSIENVTSTGSYIIDVIDLESGCASFTVVIVTDDDLVFETTDVEQIPIITNGIGDYYSGAGIIVVETVLDAFNLEYDWLPGPGNDEVDGVYSELEDPTIYTVVINVEGTTCELEFDVDMSDSICYVLVDMNGDGLVNGADLAIFLTVLNTTCPNPDTFCTGDFNLDGIINSTDLSLFLGNFGCSVQDICNGICNQ